MSKLFIDFTIAARSLLQHRRRTIFLGAAIGSVTALLILLVGLTTGIRETMLDTATTLSTGHLNVGGFYKVTAGQVTTVVTDYQKVLEVVKRSVPEMEFVVQRGRGWVNAVSDTRSEQRGLSGIELDQEQKLSRVLMILSGNLADVAKPGTIVIFADQAEKLDVKVGDAITLSAPTSRGVNNTIDVRVVAIAKNLGLLSRFESYVSMETLRTLYQLRTDTAGAIHIMLKPSAVEHAEEIGERLQRALDASGFRMMDHDPRPYWMKVESVQRENWTGQKLDVTTWEDEISFIIWSLKALQGLTVVLVTILVGIVVIGIMNTMWIAIRERTREIGTLRAIGMQRRSVLWLFLLESLMLGLVGTVAGALMGTAIAAGLNGVSVQIPLSVQLFLVSDHLHLVVHLTLLCKTIAGITGITGIASLYPSIRAARLRPVVAMGHFG